MLSSRQQTRSILSVLLTLALLLLGACQTASPLHGNNPDEIAVRRLLALMDERLSMAPLVAKSKWNSGAAIDDPAREQQILDGIALRAQREELDAAWAKDFFQSQFDAGKIVQTQLHARWRQQKLGPFEDAPDLARDVRPVLDRLTPELI
ncbi:gamma subclass chorismate mutase AroQ, partial [Undibacterium sp.]|uniref:gamma subclass chorismate mutase AroQ n=1 Tax=Undibacterium sp. TaxID=1914977 RepID=UPI002BE2D259